MKIKVLGQGFEATSKNAVGNQLIKLLADSNFNSFTAISAFSSLAGVRGLSKHIVVAKKHLDAITIVTGVDQKGTSKEALEELLALNVGSYVFYQPSITIFHPKIYLFEGKDKTDLIIGSSNLTSQGFFTNIETSIYLSVDNSVKADREIINQLKKYFKGIFDFTDPNTKKLSKKLITDLVKAKIVPTEAERKSTQDKVDKAEKKNTTDIIAKVFPKRAIARIPKEFNTSKKAITQSAAILAFAAMPTAKGKIVWTRKKIPRSSVQLSTGNPTGGLRLVQDGFIVNGHRINQTTYFRKKLFSKYDWKQVKKNPFVEAAIIPFGITIFGDFMGTFKLEVRHKPSGEAGQGNYTTSISWGELGETIREANLTGSRLDLYEPKGKRNPFHIVIS